MYQNLLRESNLYQSLHQLDGELALEAQKEGCECGGVLHRALYPRKPRGAPASTSRDYQWRWSFCCSEEGCRRRRTPPSVLFLGRKVYFAAVVILVSGITPGTDTREDFEARGTGRRERADDQPMATVVAGDDCAEPILGGGARPLSHAGRREELAARVAPSFLQGGKARGARASFVFSPPVDAVNGARLLMVVEDPQKMPSTVSE